MRMNQNQNLDAIQVINNYSESELSNLFYLNGDLKNSKKIAKKICKERENKKFTMSNDLNYVLENLKEILESKKISVNVKWQKIICD